eukprot:3765229-Rhodomonas_salina.1
MRAGLAGHVAPVAPGGGCVRPSVLCDKNARSGGLDGAVSLVGSRCTSKKSQQGSWSWCSQAHSGG